MHPLLERQANSLLNERALLPAECEALMAAVSDAYTRADTQRQNFERALEQTSEKLRAALAELAHRQLAEAQLEQLLSLLGTTLESTDDGIMVLDNKGKLVRFNQRLIEIWHIPDDVAAFWKHERMMESLCSQLEQPEDFNAKMDNLSRHPEESGFFLMECRDGRLIECHSLPHQPGMDTVGRVFSFRDATERIHADKALHREKEEQQALIRQLESAHNQLLQSEKMASIGQLAAGVAHEINNPIGYVNSNLGSLGNYVEKMIGIVEAYEQAETALPHPLPLEEAHALKRQADWEFLKQDARDLLKESAEGIARVKQIVQDLKDFSHVDEMEWQRVDLHKGIDSTLNIVRNEIKYNAEVIKDYGTIPPVACFASQLNQVFMNMLVNASHAIGEGKHGKITIRTGTENDMVWIEFSDTGKGIAPENLKRIFDPFFTTKPVGKGTGLGLSLSFGIVEKHGGHIEVESKIDNGTTFRVWLPVEQYTGDTQTAGSIFPIQ